MYESNGEESESDESDIVNGGIQEDDSNSGNFQRNKKAIMEESDRGSKDDATQRFAREGDSGCVYYLIIKKDGQHLKAPIAIHRGSSRHGKRISYGSPIGMALKKMTKRHGLDVWFPIVD